MSADSHADHRLGESGTAITLDTLDALWTGLGRPEVGLVKIDVQGAEMRVLAGARELIEVCRPALYVEVDADPARVDRAGAVHLLAQLSAMGYRANRARWVGAADRRTSPRRCRGETLALSGLPVPARLSAARPTDPKRPVESRAERWMMLTMMHSPHRCGEFPVGSDGRGS